MKNAVERAAEEIFTAEAYENWEESWAEQKGNFELHQEAGQASGELDKKLSQTMFCFPQRKLAEMREKQRDLNSKKVLVERIMIQVQHFSEKLYFCSTSSGWHQLWECQGYGESL